jgi:hypothetical protein
MVVFLIVEPIAKHDLTELFVARQQLIERSELGGLGRTINGSYAEYTRAPVSNVALIESDLPWADVAAIPETHATAWTCRAGSSLAKRPGAKGATSTWCAAPSRISSVIAVPKSACGCSVHTSAPNGIGPRCAQGIVAPANVASRFGNGGRGIHRERRH